MKTTSHAGAKMHRCQESEHTRVKLAEPCLPADRVCQVCHSLAMEDEQHFLLHCPVYDHICHSYPALFSGHIPTVASVVNTPHAPLFGRYLKQCFSHRRAVLG